MSTGKPSKSIKSIKQLSKKSKIQPNKKTVKSTTKSTDKFDEKSSESNLLPEKAVRFVGVSLAGGKSDKACIAVVEYYPESQKVFLSRLFEKIKTESHISGDLKIHELIFQNSDTLKYVAFDSPWILPNCLTCKLKCPGFEVCTEPHIEWLWGHQKEKCKKKSNKLFTPYTQRCVELYLSTELEEVFNLSHCMGANSAPLLARAAFIQKRIPFDCIEVYPKLSFFRIGHYLGLMKSILRDHRAAFGGEESRAQFIHAMNEKNLMFIYHQDAKSMTDNSHAFDAYICALTAFLKFKNQTELRPKKFPATESWIEFPKLKLDF